MSYKCFSVLFWTVNINSTSPVYSCAEKAVKTVLFLASIPKIEIKKNLTENASDTYG